MSTLRRAVPLAMLAIATAFPASAQEAQVPPPSSTRGGVYTVEQAQHGKELMRDVCAECHMDEEFMGTFIKSWAGASVGDLFEEVSTKMPEDRPGSLRPREYAQVLAYIFQLNGLPPGEVPMPSSIEELREIIIEGSQG